MKITHHLLKHQIKQHLGNHEVIPDEMESLLLSVEEAYMRFEAANGTLEHSAPQETSEGTSRMRAVLECLIQRTPVGIFAFDHECRYTLWNPTMQRFTTLSEQQTLGQSVFDIFPDLKEDGLDHFFYEALSGTTTPPVERDFSYSDTDEQGFCEFFLTPLFSESGAIIGGLGILRDVGERKRMKMSLQRQNEYLHVLQKMALRFSGKEELEGFFENMLRHICQLMETPHAFMYLMEAGSFKLVKRFTAGIFEDTSGLGFLYNEQLIARIRELREPILINNPQYLADRELDQLSSWIAIPLFQENKIIGVIGVAYTEPGKSVRETEATLLMQFAQLVSIGLEHEVLHEANTRLTTLATVDPLTNLPNHRTIISHIEEIFAHSRNTQEECAILFLDIDKFKHINDTWGHQAGDEVLREVARRLMSNVRKEDFVGRYGGEEFALVLPGINLEMARQKAERLRQILNVTPCFWEAEHGKPTLAIPLSASIGLAMYRLHGQTRKELIEAADLAMYEAKRRGRNRVCIAGDKGENSTHVDFMLHFDEMTSAR